MSCGAASMCLNHRARNPKALEPRALNQRRPCGLPKNRGALEGSPKAEIPKKLRDRPAGRQERGGEPHGA